MPDIYGLDPYREPEEGPLGPKVEFNGEVEPNVWMWSVRSHENMLWRYEVTLDWETAVVQCSCRHAYRRLNKDRPPLTQGCKHVDDICMDAARILEARGEL